MSCNDMIVEEVVIRVTVKRGLCQGFEVRGLD